MPDDTIRKLVIRAPNWLGDAVMSEPVIAAARDLAPGAEVAVLARPAVAELLKGHPSVDRLYLYVDPGRHQGLAGTWRLARELRRERFDMAILLQNAFGAALLARLAGIPRRCGYATDGRGWLLTDSVAVPRDAREIHHTAYFRHLLRSLGGGVTARAPRLYLAEEEKEILAASLRGEAVGDRDVIIGLNPGSTYGRAKRWLPERFAATADALAERLRAQENRPVRVVLVGGRGEEALGEAIANEMKTRPIRWAGKTTIRQLMALVSRCRIFVTNDTGPMHIAAALGVPVVAVFGPTDPRTTSPIGDRTTLISQPVDCAPCLLRECPIDHRCMTGVSTHTVVEAASRLLRADTRQADTLTRNGQRHRSASCPDVSACDPVSPSAPLAGTTVFVDRDGTLNRDTGYIGRPEDLELLSGSGEAVARLNQAGARVILVTNQSGIGRGFFSVEDLTRVHGRLRDLLARSGARLDGIYYCPHHPEEGCACRKPGTALIDRAVGDLGIDLTHAYVVGDQWRDVELARRVGAKGILVGNAAGPPGDPCALADHMASGIAEAVEWIIAQEMQKHVIG